RRGGRLEWTGRPVPECRTMSRSDDLLALHLARGLIGLAMPHGPPPVAGRPRIRPPWMRQPPAPPPPSPADDPVGAADALRAQANGSGQVVDQLAANTQLIPSADQLTLVGELATLVRRALAAAKFLQDRGDTNPILHQAIMAHRTGKVGRQ